MREVAGESLIVTRRKDGGLGPLQRLPPPGHAAVTETGRFADRIQCPYHGWTYGLDGRLLGAPHMDGVPGFRREDNGLTPVAVADWEGISS